MGSLCINKTKLFIVNLEHSFLADIICSKIIGLNTIKSYQILFSRDSTVRHYFVFGKLMGVDFIRY